MFPCDFRGAYRYVRLLLLVYFYQKTNVTVPAAFKATARRHPDRKCLVYQGRAWTFRDLHEYSNKVAHFMIREGYKPGDCLALFMHNRPVRGSIIFGCREKSRLKGDRFAQITENANVRCRRHFFQIENYCV